MEFSLNKHTCSWFNKIIVLLESNWLVTCSSDNVQEIFLVSLLETVLVFLTNQAAQFYSCGIVYFIFMGISCGYPLNGSIRDFWLNHSRVNIFQVCSISVSFASMYFFIHDFCCLTPMRLESSRIRKSALFLPSHRLKKYKNLHPQSFINGAKMW